MKVIVEMGDQKFEAVIKQERVVRGLRRWIELNLDPAKHLLNMADLYLMSEAGECRREDF